MLDWSGRRSDDGGLKDAIAGKPCSYVLIVPTLCVGMHPWTLCVRF